MLKLKNLELKVNEKQKKYKESISILSFVIISEIIYHKSIFRYLDRLLAYYLRIKKIQKLIV